MSLKKALEALFSKRISCSQTARTRQLMGTNPFVFPEELQHMQQIVPVAPLLLINGHFRVLKGCFQTLQFV